MQMFNDCSMIERWFQLKTVKFEEIAFRCKVVCQFKHTFLGRLDDIWTHIHENWIGLDIKSVDAHIECD